MISFLSLLGLLSFFYVTRAQKCNEVTFSVTVPLGSNLGSFTVSTNRCQAVKFLVPEFKFEVQMSLYFECDGNYLKASVYDDLYCEQLSGKTYKVHKDDDINILSGLAKLTIESLSCDNNDCYGEFLYSENCTSSLSETYLSLSFPFRQCLGLTVVDDSDNEGGSRLNGDSVEFDCCKNSEDLLLYNYSTPDCDDSPNVYRFDSKYNGKCFKLMQYDENSNDHSNNNGIGGLLYASGRRFLQESNSNNQGGVFMFSYKCPKHDLVDCTNIDLVSEENFPPQCADTCKDKLQHNSDGGSDGGSDDGSSRNGHNNSKSSKNVTILGTLFGGIVVILIIVVVSVLRKNKKLKKELKNDQEVVIAKEKYEPMIEESGPNTNNDVDNITSDIILPTDVGEVEEHNIDTNEQL